MSEVEPTRKTNDAGETPASRSKKMSEQTELSLVEIGPRFVMTPIIILEGSFGGPVIYENKEFVSPNAVRADLREMRVHKYNSRTEDQQRLEIKRKELGLEVGKAKGELDESILFS